MPPVRWHEPIDTRRLPLAGLLAAAVAIGVNVALREAGRRWLKVPADEPLLSLVLIGALTAAAALVGTLGMAVFAHTQARPFTVFRAFAGVVLLVSCAGPLLARTGWIHTIGPTTTPTMAVMLLLHLVTTAVIVAFLTTLPRAYDRRRF
jgi:hypothetical protein